jgi:purine-binding chemotaxis protein CheW
MSELRTEDLLNPDDDISMKYLTFRIGDQFFGISIENVISIVQVEAATPLPELPYYAKGIINLRGRVVPLIDVNLRFGRPEPEYNDRTCIIIIDIGGVHVGFIVEAVEEVKDVEESQISSPPRFTGGMENRYVTGVYKAKDRMILLLDSRLLFSDEEFSMFESIS